MEHYITELLRVAGGTSGLPWLSVELSCQEFRKEEEGEGDTRMRLICSQENSSHNYHESHFPRD